MMDSNRGKGNKTCIMREIHFSGLEHSNPITQMGFLAKLANTVVKKKKKNSHPNVYYCSKIFKCYKNKHKHCRL